jgi:glycosyltransferase involved in cell wall biosynthesis
MSRWSVVAEFFSNRQSRWLDDFIADPDLVFTKIPATRREDWHRAARPRTGMRKWLRLLGQGWRAFDGRPDGIITCFPQLAMTVAFIKRLTFRKTRLIAHNFNLGGFPPGARRSLARFAARGIDILVVHSPSEVRSYADYLALPPARIRFVRLQRGLLDLTRAEDVTQPFLLAMGSAGRDYATLIEATRAQAIPTVIVTRKDIIDTLPAAAHVTFHHGLTAAECLALLARARITVVPIANVTTASGQVTFIDAMMLGTPLIATRCPGTEGYVEDGETGLLVPPFDAKALQAAIDSLWFDPQRSAALAAQASRFAHTSLSDEAAAATLQGFIRELL